MLRLALIAISAVVSTAAPAPHPVLGSWDWPGGARRVIHADRSAETFDNLGAPGASARCMFIDAATVDLKYDDGHFERCRVQEDGSLLVTSRPRGGNPIEFRAQRTAVEAATADEQPTTGDRPSPPAARKADRPGSFLGRWRFPGQGGPVREFTADGYVDYFRADGQRYKHVKASPAGGGALVALGDDGWDDTYRLRPDGTIVAHARSGGGAEVNYTGERMGDAPPAPVRAPEAIAPRPADAAQVSGIWQPLDATNRLIVVLADGTVFGPREAGRWRFDAATRRLSVDWDSFPDTELTLSADGDALRAGTSDAWRRRTPAPQRAQNRARWTAAALTDLVTGSKWYRNEDGRGGVYVFKPGGSAVKYETPESDQPMDEATYWIFPDELLLVVRWRPPWRDYFPLPPPEQGTWRGWNSAGDPTVRIRKPLR